MKGGNKMRSTVKLLIVAFFLGAFLFGTNANAGKGIDWSRSADLAVIEGKINSINLEKMYFTLDECEELGNEPLILNEDTTCYIGNEKTDIVSIGEGTKFQKEDELSFDQLKSGDYVKCNYSRKYGKFIAVRIVRIPKQIF